MSKGFDVPPGRDADLGDENSSVAETTAASLAAYIAEMSAELALMAERADLALLCYFLRLARVEAEENAHRLASPAPTVDGAGRA